MLDAFEDLNAELKRDIPALISDTEIFIAATFAQFIRIKTDFFLSIANFQKQVADSL